MAITFKFLGFSNVEIGVTSDGKTIVCHHPTVDIPYELTQVRGGFLTLDIVLHLIIESITYDLIGKDSKRVIGSFTFSSTCVCFNRSLFMKVSSVTLNSLFPNFMNAYKTLAQGEAAPTAKNNQTTAATDRLNTISVLSTNGLIEIVSRLLGINMWLHL